MREIIILVLVIVCFTVLTGCNLGNYPPSFVKQTEWLSQNIDSTFFTKSSPTAPASAFRGFFVFASDPNGNRDLELITVTDPQGYMWVLLDREVNFELYNSSEGYWGGSGFYSSSDPDRMFVGDYTVLLRDRSGVEVTQVFSVLPPSGTGGQDYMYSEDYGTGPYPNSEPMLKRASVISETKNINDLEIVFTVVDSAVSNVCVRFYDNSESFIIQTDYEPVAETGGNPNTITVTDSDVGVSNFADIYGFHLSLIDGPSDAWLHQSRSAYGHF